ncbi:MAG: extracellular solute-binding protein [Firmicutes bacterium]|nr:extracellular solute-binding protein [Bacillota bacterium]
MAKKGALLLIIAFLSIVSLSTHVVFADTKVYDSGTSLLLEGNYREVLSVWENEGYQVTSSFEQVISPSQFSVSNPLDESLSMDYGQDVAQFNDENIIEFSVVVDTEGLYEFSLDFYSKSSDYLDLECSVLVNDELQYTEASQIILYKQWVQVDGFTLDRYGNDFYGSQEQNLTWIHQSFYDPMGLFVNPIVFKLNQGMNTITIERTKGDFLVGDFTVSGRTTLSTYDEYSNGASLISNEILNSQEAETPSFKNASSIQAGVSRTVDVTPFSVRYLKLNILAGSTFNSQREEVIYDVEVAEEGYYYLTFKVLQSTSTNANVYRTLRINGTVPFEEALSIPFEYDNLWQNVTLGGDEPYLFHLNQGINQISLSVNLSPFMEDYYEINDVLDYVNDLSLQIKKLTGNQIDENRDWLITDYIPSIVADLLDARDSLQVTYDRLDQMTETTKLSEAMSSIKIAIRNLVFLADSPNDIPKNMTLLSTSSSSIASTLGTTVALLLDSPLDIDKFYVHTDVELDKPNANFFVRTWVNIKRFFLSFFDERYNMIANDDELDVWVNRSKQYTDLIQKMADDSFTTETGIKVKISVMAAEGKLILANSAGTNPDVALGVSSWLPYDLGIRGAILDLTTFLNDPEFSTVLDYYQEESLIPLIYDDGLYGLPDTENFYVLFYRNDILSALDIPVPSTWEEVTQIMPILKRYGMNFYIPLSSATSLKSFDSTLPFLFQYGSSIYQDNAFYVSLDDEASINALTMMTELYTIYSMDTTVTSFYNEFRLGISPIGVGDFGMYITLLNAAPDIQGLWKIALLPGVVQEDSSIDRSAPGAQTANMIFKNTDKQEESWEFLKWWSSTEIQVEFESLLLSTLGKEYLWNSANTLAFEALNMNSDDLSIILEQWSYLRELPKVPGSYQVELEISNLWNSVVIDRENLRVLLNDGIIKMNKEIQKKMSEFGYMDKTGTIMKPYNLASLSIIRSWKSGDSNE